MLYGHLLLPPAGDKGVVYTGRVTEETRAVICGISRVCNWVVWVGKDNTEGEGGTREELIKLRDYTYKELVITISVFTRPRCSI